MEGANRLEIRAVKKPTPDGCNAGTNPHKLGIRLQVTGIYQADLATQRPVLPPFFSLRKRNVEAEGAGERVDGQRRLSPLTSTRKQDPGRAFRRTVGPSALFRRPK